MTLSPNIRIIACLLACNCELYFCWLSVKETGSLHMKLLPRLLRCMFLLNGAHSKVVMKKFWFGSLSRKGQTKTNRLSSNLYINPCAEERTAVLEIYRYPKLLLIRH